MTATRGHSGVPARRGAALAYRSLGTALATAGSDAYVDAVPAARRPADPPRARHGRRSRHRTSSTRATGRRLGPLRLFGHCMGAVVAFEFARDRRAQGVEVSALWVSASEAPSTVAASPALPTAEVEILAEMVDLGGTDPQLLADDDFVELLLMAVRADYARVQPLRVRHRRDDRRRHPHARRRPRPPRQRGHAAALGRPTPPARSRCRCSTAATSTSTTTPPTSRS